MDIISDAITLNSRSFYFKAWSSQYAGIINITIMLIKTIFKDTKKTQKN